MIHKFLRLFVNTFKVDEKHYPLNRDNLTEPIKMQLSEKRKGFSEFFFGFLKSILKFEHLPIQMTLIPYVFPQTPTPKNMVTSMA